MHSTPPVGELELLPTKQLFGKLTALQSAITESQQQGKGADIVRPLQAQHEVIKEILVERGEFDTAAQWRAAALNIVLPAGEAEDTAEDFGPSDELETENDEDEDLFEDDGDDDEEP